MNFPPTIVAHFMPQQYTAHSTLKTTKQSVSVKKDCEYSGVYVRSTLRIYIYVYYMVRCTGDMLCKAPSDGFYFFLHSDSFSSNILFTLTSFHFFLFAYLIAFRLCDVVFSRFGTIDMNTHMCVCVCRLLVDVAGMFDFHIKSSMFPHVASI